LFNEKDEAFINFAIIRWAFWISRR